MKKLLLILGVALAALPMKAWDFFEANEDHVRIYYNKVERAGGNFCEVVRGDGAYTEATINIPLKVENTDDNKTYYVIGIGDKAFINSNEVEMITVPNTIEYIGEHAFENTGLKHFDMPISVKEIRANAFAATSLDYFSLECDSPEDITMGNRVFNGAFSFADPYLLVPKGSASAFKAAAQWSSFDDIREAKFNFIYNNVACMVTNEETGACEAVYRNPLWYLSCVEPDCWSLRIDGKFTHNGVEYQLTSIDTEVFKDVKLSSVYLPETLQKIGMRAFQDNSGYLTRVFIPGSVKEIYPEAFAGCKVLKLVVSEILQPDKIYMGYDVFKGVDFDVCELSVPASVAWDYYECEQWNQFFYINERPYDFRVDGVAYKIEGSGCYVAPNMEFDNEIYSNTDYIIPAAVTFDGTVYTVDGIEPLAFAKSTTTSVFFQSVRVIGQQAFSDSKIKFVYLPATLEKIGYAAFVGCSDLEFIYNYVADPADIALDLEVFSGVNKEDCILYVPNGSVELYRAAAQWKDFTNIMGFDTAIDNIAADAASDAPAVYYNLNGIAMPAGDLAPGLYIRRQGTDVSKVIIK